MLDKGGNNIKAEFSQNEQETGYQGYQCAQSSDFSLAGDMMFAPVLVAGILGLLVGKAMPVCVPTEYTLYVEKPECDYCVAINTTICMGFCFSRDSNMKELVGPRFLIQRSCTYQDVEYRTAVLPGCAPHADSHFTYPIAHSCYCSMCNTHRDECAHKTRFSAAKCIKPVQHSYPYSGQSDYV
ncbi:thyroid stimulating hormone subunit beta a [Clarias gariepinus]|uniref:thyroid stimulating hormone subunit beta a n=1 Tax=Clarias gariepinus TaxID=13013 RepID=UPI00234D5CB9|nr:thyroid stimulating hormone subunit beta a [Clarias gariepinus]